MHKVAGLGIVSPSSRRAWIEIVPLGRFRDLQPVALLAEGVDRNQLISKASGLYSRSPSSRRAWIEIPLQKHRQISS